MIGEALELVIDAEILPDMDHWKGETVLAIFFDMRLRKWPYHNGLLRWKIVMMKAHHLERTRFMSKHWKEGVSNANFR